MRLVVVTIVGVVFGFFIGISFPTVSITKVYAHLYQRTAVYAWMQTAFQEADSFKRAAASLPF